MRITNAMMMNQALRDLAGLRQNYAKAQAAVNGRSLERPSEDPQRVVEAMDLSGTKLRLERSKRAGEDASEWLSVAEVQMTAMIDQLQSAREYATQAGSPSSQDSVGQEALASTMDAIKESLLQEMNAQHRDQYIFSGQKTDTLPFTVDPVTGAAKYRLPFDATNPHDGEISHDVAPGLSIVTNAPGQQLLNGGDFIKTLTDIAAALRAGDTQTVTNAKLDELKQEISHLSEVRSVLGVRQNQVTQFGDHAQSVLLQIEDRMTTITGTDIETSILKMTEAQNAYQAALASFAKALPTSLLDYMMR